jgi:EmrB/QacA subfamily drug resistance transporter
MASVQPEALGESTDSLPAPISLDQPRFSRRETVFTMIAVSLVMLLASLDQTIVTTALPRIISDFNGLDRYTWVTTAYLLTSTIMIPIYGKLSDLFGRKPIFLIGVVLFLIGSAASGVSQSMNELIAFRAFQGLGAAALMPIALAVIGDLFPPRERGKWQGVLGAAFGVSAILGPTLGGWLTDNASWRWIFYVNLPVGIVALLFLIFLMPTLRGQSRHAKIDYSGALLLTAGVVPLMLGFTWAGSQYDWISPQILGLFGGAVVALVLFFVYEAMLERRQAEPIIAPSLFKNSVFVLSIVITMLITMAMFGGISFLPLFAQSVLGLSASNSGLLLTPMMLALIVSSVLSGLLVSRFGTYKWITILGAVISIAGGLLLLRLNIDSSSNDLWIAMVVLGLGLGFGISIYTLIVQNAMPDRIGEATAALTFFRQIGATISLSAMGSVLVNAYQPGFTGALTSQVKQLASQMLQQHIDILGFFSNPNILLSASAQAQMVQQFSHIPHGPQLYGQLMDAVKVGLTQGVHNVFLFTVAFLILSLVIVFFLKEIPLRTSQRAEQSVETEENLPPVGETPVLS